MSRVKQAALAARLKAQQARAANAEAALAAAKGGRGGLDADVGALAARGRAADDDGTDTAGSDIESADERRGGGGGGGGLTRRRPGARGRGGAGGASSRSIAKAIQPLGLAPSVTRKVDAVDAASLTAMSFLRASPIARLGFLLYLVGLHFWVFAVLAFHSHRMSVSGDHLNVAVPPAAGLTHSVIPALPPP